MSDLFQRIWFIAVVLLKYEKKNKDGSITKMSKEVVVVVAVAVAIVVVLQNH